MLEQVGRIGSRYAGVYLDGLLGTLWLSLVTAMFAVLIGIAVSMLKRSRIRIVQIIVDFYIEFNEKPWPFCPNRKCFISYARIQGFRAITQHFSSSNIMLVNNGEVKPYISDE